MQIFLCEETDGSWRVAAGGIGGLPVPTLAQAVELADRYMSLLEVEVDLVVSDRHGRRDVYQASDGDETAE